MANRGRTRTFGWIVLIIGTILLVSHYHPISLDWTAVLMIIGIGLFVAGILQKDHGAVFPGTFLFLFGLLFSLKNSRIILMDWWELWPVILLLLGIAFLAHYIFDTDRKGRLLPGILLIAIAFLLLFVPFCWYDIFYWVSKLWPVILIITGLYLIIKSTRRRKNDEIT